MFPFVEKIKYLPVFSFCMFLSACNPADDASKASSADEPFLSKIPASLVESDHVSGDNAMFHAAQIVSFGDRAPGTEGYRRQIDYLSEALSKLKWSVSKQSFEANTPAGKKGFTNLRVRFGENADFSNAVSLAVSCHIDTKTGIPGFVGANDGASGAAVLLELARILTKTPDMAKSIELVFFDGEESFEWNMSPTDGLYGSSYYADTLAASLPSYLINLDMVGRQNMKIRIPPDTHPLLYQLYNKTCEELKLPPGRWGVSSNDIWDDHKPFVQKGIPCLNIIDDFNDGSWWHTSRDNLDILSAKSLQEAGAATLHIIKRLLN